MKCLEIGGRRGGPSLWLASQGHSVVCTDLECPEAVARPLHEAHGLGASIVYRAADALELPAEWESAFDCVVFKSVLGGVSRDGQTHRRQQVIDGIWKCLRPGGMLLFAENLEGTHLHRFFRRTFVRWGGSWNYLRAEDVEPLFANFGTMEWSSAGFLGAFGRSEMQRSALGWIDSVLFDRITPRSARYVGFGVAKKVGVGTRD